MTDKSITRMNLSAIKKIDPYAKEIVDSSSHVAFYTFNSDQNEWEKTDVEGAFFIYHRNAEPLHSIFINNRLNTTSFVEPITGNLELQSQPPFLLYRNERSRIRGFWFYNSEECDRMSSLVNSLLQNKATNGERSLSLLTCSKPENTSIFNMLSQAQKEYDAQLINQSQPKISVTQSENVTSRNVLKFFESAKQATKEAQLVRVQPLSVDQLEKQQSAPKIEANFQSSKRDGEFVTSQSLISPFLEKSTFPIAQNAEKCIQPINEPKLINHIDPVSDFISSEYCLRRLLVGDNPEVKPVLMLPTMFDVPNLKPELEQSPLQPLNATQFVEAFDYLIHNDKDFVTKLHKAYISGCSKSLIDPDISYQ